MQSVIVVYPDSSTKVQNPIKQPNIMSQQGSKIKKYAGTNVADRTIQIDPIKRNILPKET